MTGSAATKSLSIGALANAIRRQATTMAIADTFGWIGILMLATMLIVLCLNETKLFRAPRFRQGAP